MWVLRGFLLQLYTEYKLLSNLGLDGVGRPFLILNGRDQPLRLRSHWEAVVGLPSCAPGRGTGWEQAPRGMLLLLASSSPLTQLVVPTGLVCFGCTLESPGELSRAWASTSPQSNSIRSSGVGPGPVAANCSEHADRLEEPWIGGSPRAPQR